MKYFQFQIFSGVKFKSLKIHFITGVQRKKNSSVKIRNTSRLIKFEQYNEINNVVRFQEFNVPSRSDIPSTVIQENDTATNDNSLVQSFEKPTDCKLESKNSEQT